MKAEIVSVGTELLLGQIADTDAQHLGQLLPQLGIAHTHRQLVGDNLDRLAEAIRLALSRADIVFTIGGLGPTQDDLTRDGIAAALDDEMVLDEGSEAQLRRIFRERKFAWVESQLRQAMRPTCAVPSPTPTGTAPGLICEKNGKVVIALPGPRGEFVPMADGPVRDYLAKLATGGVIVSRLLRTCGVGEGVVEDKIKGLLASTNPTIAPYAKVGEVHLRLTALAPSSEEAEALIAPMEARVREALGDAVYGLDAESLEQVLLGLLRERGAKLAVAESCTGGGLGVRLTSVSGASDVFVGGAISYSNEVKTNLLGVDPDLFAEGGPGAVSAECAVQMAEGACKRFGADYGVSITGVAGPTGGTGEKPVGTVFVGVATPDGTYTEHYKFRASREGVRERSVQSALILLRAKLLAQIGVAG
jgi:nicotinamide-nucleotide amidase